ncbi:MAG: hypothetical protein ACRBCS_05240 [Cellvibrionaceae bacterium]
MNYLCPKHQQHILQDPKLAKTLWGGAMKSGLIAYEQERWKTARVFFGSAYETTLLYMWNKPITDKITFSIEHLIDAGQSLSNSLKKLKEWDEAQVCLLTLQNSLLHLNSINSKDRNSNNDRSQNKEFQSSFLTREETLNLTNNFVTTLAESLNLQTHFTHNTNFQCPTDKQNSQFQKPIKNKHPLSDISTTEVH